MSLRLLLTLFLVWPFIALADSDDEESRTVSPGDFETCALPVLRGNEDIDKIDRLRETCAAELHVFTLPDESAPEPHAATVPPESLAKGPREVERERLAAAYEGCMAMAFKLEFKVDKAFSACHKQLDSYLDTHDKPVRRALELADQGGHEHGALMEGAGY